MTQRPAFVPRFSKTALADLVEIIGTDAPAKLIEADLLLLLAWEREERAAGHRKREGRRFFVQVLAGRLERYGIRPSASRGVVDSPFLRVLKLCYEACGLPNADPYRITCDAIKAIQGQPLEDVLTPEEFALFRPIAARKNRKIKEIQKINRTKRRATR